jgi:hypothetical protein
VDRGQPAATRFYVELPPHRVIGSARSSAERSAFRGADFGTTASTILRWSRSFQTSRFENEYEDAAHARMVVAYVFEQVIGLLPFQAMVAEQHVRTRS